MVENADNPSWKIWTQLDLPRPLFKGIDCSELLKKSYGISAKRLECLNGFIDLSIKVEDGGANIYVLKLFRKVLDDFRGDADQTEAEITNVTFLHQRGFPVSEIIPTKEGKKFDEAEFVCNKSGKVIRRFRLQRYIDGAIFSYDASEDLYRKFGDLAGRVDSTLADFHHPFFENRDDTGSLLRVGAKFDVKDNLDKLTNERHRSIADEYMRLYDERIVSKKDRLPIQQIHSDLHGGNIVTNADATEIVGLLDFSEARTTFRIIEAGLALSGINVVQKVRPYHYAKAFLDGYQRHVSFTQAERDALPIVMAGRIVSMLIYNQAMKLTNPNYDSQPLDQIYPPEVSWKIVESLLFQTGEADEFFSAFRIGDAL